MSVLWLVRVGIGSITVQSRSYRMDVYRSLSVMPIRLYTVSKPSTGNPVLYEVQVGYRTVKYARRRVDRYGTVYAQCSAAYTILAIDVTQRVHDLHISHMNE